MMKKTNKKTSTKKTKSNDTVVKQKKKKKVKKMARIHGLKIISIKRTHTRFSVVLSMAKKLTYSATTM